MLYDGPGFENFTVKSMTNRRCNEANGNWLWVPRWYRRT